VESETESSEPADADEDVSMSDEDGDATEGTQVTQAVAASSSAEGGAAENLRDLREKLQFIRDTGAGHEGEMGAAARLADETVKEITEILDGLGDDTEEDDSTTDSEQRAEVEVLGD